MQGACPEDGLRRAWRMVGWLAGVTVVFQRMEPWAYEAAWAVGIALAAARGVRLPRPLLSFALLMTANVAGFFLSALLVAADDRHALLWAAVSAYLATTALLTAAYVGEDPRAGLSVLGRAMVAGGALSAAVAMVGRVSSGDLYYFLMNGQASALFVPKNIYTNLRGVGFFKDPNVYAAFMVVPILVVLGWIARERGRRLLACCALLAFLAVGLLLATSRGAYLNLAVALAVFGLLSAVAAPDRASLSRSVLRLVLGCAVLGGATALAFALPAVRGDVAERATASMPYDQGPFGRWAGIRMAKENLARPLGLGPLQFWRAYVANSTPANMAEWFRGYDAGPRNPNVEAYWTARPERTEAQIREFWRLHASNPHNVYLDQFMAGGWLSGLSYLALLAATMAVALRTAARRPPWWRAQAAFAAALFGACAEGAVIDTEHWRHFFLLLGAVWGCWAAGGGAPGGLSRSRLSFFKDSSTFRHEVGIAVPSETESERTE